MTINKHYLKYFYTIGILIVLVGLIMLKPWYKKEIVMQDLTNMNIDEIKKYAEKNDLNLEIIEQNSFDINKNQVISQSVCEGKKIEPKDKLKVVISLGPVDKKVYSQNKVNELGNIPIMMYHGIVNQKANYIGGNVDKEGYTRTAEAFKKDLEFFYQNNYYMISLNDYINDLIDVPLGKSPIILTFDDGNKNNIKVIGSENNQLIIDSNSAIGILEEFKKEHPDTNVTATFFVESALFNQPDYNNQILNWLVDHGYDVGNHSATHPNFLKISEDQTVKEIGEVYSKLEQIIPNRYVKIVALPFGTPYSDSHINFKHILKGTYQNKGYETKATLRVGWDSEKSPFHKDFNAHFLKRIRAYDNNGKDFDIEMNFRLLEKTRYISDGNIETIVIPKNKENLLKNNSKKVITY